MNKEIEKYPSSNMLIRFQDCDPMSHLNNGSYFDYFMNAREDHLKEFYDFNIYERLKEKGQGWVVAKSEILYRKPAYLMENVKMISHVNNFSLKHIEFEVAMYDETGANLKSLMRSVLIPFDVRANKVIEHDDEVMDLLKRARVEGISNNIEERIAQLEGMMNVS